MRLVHEHRMRRQVISRINGAFSAPISVSGQRCVYAVFLYIEAYRLNPIRDVKITHFLIWSFLYTGLVNFELNADRREKTGNRNVKALIKRSAQQKWKQRFIHCQFNKVYLCIQFNNEVTVFSTLYQIFTFSI